MINYKYIQTLQFPLKSFLSTIIKVKNYKNYLPWCLDSFEKSHKSYELSLEEIRMKLPELLSNKYIRDYLISQNCLNKQENYSNTEEKILAKKFPIKTFDGYIKVGFDLIEFSYLSKVYLISENIVLSRTDDTHSNIFKKLESTWILSDNDNSSNNELISNENLYLINYKSIDDNYRSKNSNEEKTYFIEGHKENSESVHVEYFIEFEMRSLVFRNLTSICINFLGENIVKSFINETQKIIKEENHLNSIKYLNKSYVDESLEVKFKKMLNYNLQIFIRKNNEKLNNFQKEKLEILFILFFSLKVFTIDEIEKIIKRATTDMSLFYNLIFYLDIFNKDNTNQIKIIGSEIKNMI